MLVITLRPILDSQLCLNPVQAQLKILATKWSYLPTYLVSPISRPQIKKLLLENILHIYQGNEREKQEMELLSKPNATQLNSKKL